MVSIILKRGDLLTCFWRQIIFEMVRAGWRNKEQWIFTVVIHQSDMHMCHRFHLFFDSWGEPVTQRSLLFCCHRTVRGVWTLVRMILSASRVESECWLASMLSAHLFEGPAVLTSGLAMPNSYLVGLVICLVCGLFFGTSHICFNIIPFIPNEPAFKRRPHGIQKSCSNNHFSFWLLYSFILLLTSSNTRSMEGCLWCLMPNISEKVSSYVSNG